jgi:membrane protein required for colicin V production
MNALDIIVIAVVLLSAAFAFARGFMKEILSIAAWIGAAFATIYGYPFVVPLAERFLPKGPLANGAAAFAVFVVALIALSLVTSTLSRRVSQSGLSSIDRLFGLIFGVLRGALLVSLAYIGLIWFMPPDKPRPPWVSEARSLPLLQAGADAIESFVPEEWRRKAKDTAAQAAGTLDQATAAERAAALRNPHPANPPPAPDKPPAYKPDDRRDLNRLIQQQN